ncbi:enoyl-CoA hydratase family protein [Streptomyces sp. UNOC14_S4]|uniref:enoyl-CoA hydratase family protein n=1 Tax=Streptomyces sp. UNOC14_S4 TaxID=2872340 RepID=UPI001E47E2DE|nr:enoyl-CoA hydratase family protein [Streptomyces sp. UNOC14_S4]MCC3767378.1 enoyl-CoA hydratase family protein [Streptomyces sp. UNOC14_S4]
MSPSPSPNPSTGPERFTGSASRTEHWRHLDLSLDGGGVATVTLSRPAKLNALTFGAYADLRDLLPELARDSSVRALVLGGEGRGFCSGGDVDEIIGATLAMDTAGLLAFNRMTGQVVQALRTCPFPVVAAVHGVAAGAGAVLALAADFRVADPTARFAFLFTKVGLSGGDMGAAYLLPRVVGLGHATRLLMLGEPVRAQEAERIGLISQLADEGGVHAAARSLARRLAAGPALALAQTKALLTAELDMPLAASVELDAATQALLMNSADYAEFHAAFTEKRPLSWQGR